MTQGNLLSIILILAGIALGAWVGSFLPRAPGPEAIEAPPIRVTRPQLPADYNVPVTEHSAPRAALLEYVDVVLLVVALSAAAYLALKKRSRPRIFVLMILCLIYFGFIRGGCVCPIGAIQHVAAALFQGTWALPLTVLAFFLLPLVFALVFGRVFCAAVCPLGAVQDIVLLRPVKVPMWLEHGLGLLAYVYLGLAVLFAATGAGYIICLYDPFVALFRLSGNSQMFVLGGSFLVIAMFVGRPYCRYLCPFGVLLRLGAKVSEQHATITPDECIQCRLCEDACPFNAITKPTESGAVPRSTGKVRLALLLGAFPLIIGAGAWLGYHSSGPLSTGHPTVRHAEAVQAARAERIRMTEQEAFRAEAYSKTKRPAAQLYAKAKAIQGQFRLGGTLLGAWVGLVIGAKLLALSVRRTRTDYEAEPGQCLACGRCFAHCPREHLRLRTLRGETPPKETETP